jgi:hypothetical protein
VGFVGIPPEGLGSIVEGLHLQFLWHVSGSACFTGSVSPDTIVLTFILL